MQKMKNFRVNAKALARILQTQHVNQCIKEIEHGLELNYSYIVQQLAIRDLVHRNIMHKLIPRCV